MKHNFETLAHLKNFVNSLNEDELKQPLRFWGEEVGGTIAAAEILNDDYINPSGESLEPRAMYLQGGEFYQEDAEMEDEPIVLHKGAIVFEVDRGGQYRNNPTFEQVFEKFAEFSLKAFVNSTASTSLNHLKTEIEEVQKELDKGTVFSAQLLAEYADCFLCLVSSASRVRIPAQLIVSAMDHKAKINQGRKWKDNGDGTYSHIKG
jgi:hypothetical protein